MRNLKSLGCLVLIGALLTISNGAWAAPVITNGSFEADGNAFSSSNGYASLGGNPANPTGWTGGGDLFGGFGNIPLIAVADTSQVFASGLNVPDGTHVAALQVYAQGSVYTTTLSTTITGLNPGSQYTISYFEDIRPGTGGVVDASVQVDSNTVVVGHAIPTSTTNFSAVTSSVFTATGATAVLTFLNQQSPTDGLDASLLIDNVTISAVPEPASLVLFGLAAVGLLAVARRRRSA